MMHASRSIYVCILALMAIKLHAQEGLNNLVWIFDTSIPVITQGNTNASPLAWTGGLNAPQFGELDINGDGVSDMLVFDKSGNKILPFIRENASYFRFAPEFADFFPPLEFWMCVRDYNGDGKPDIFSSANNGIKAWKNVTEPGGNLQFELVDALIGSDYGNAVLNLFVSAIDMPAFEDIDGDGDIDILTFFILGTCVEYHRNLSVELTGAADSLVFRRESNSWGLFTESFTTNSIQLNDSCGRADGPNRHTGSTLLLHDMDNDGDMDLLLGDVSYTELQTLINGGSSNFAQIIPTPGNYPAIFNEYGVEVFPAGFRVDANGDGLPDLVVAPNVQDFARSSGDFVSLHLSQAGQFAFTQAATPFLSHLMIDAGRGAYPALIDVDNDGDLDIVLGNFGRYVPSGISGEQGTYKASLQLYRNVGTAQNPSFAWESNDFAGLGSLNQTFLAPAFGDLTGDGIPDLLVGTRFGEVLFFRATGNETYVQVNGVMPELSFANYTTPAIIDLDNDGLNDIVLGDRNGKFNYYRNTGTANLPSFPTEPSISNLGNAETINELSSVFGYNTPFFKRINDISYMFSGSEDGRLFVWQVGELNQGATWALIDSSLGNIDEGIWSSLAIADINADGFDDLITGNRRGGLSFYKGVFPDFISSTKEETNWIAYPNPANESISFHINSAGTFKGLLRITDLSGRVIHREEIHSPHTLNTQAFESGMYTASFENEKSKYHVRFIVMKK